MHPRHRWLPADDDIIRAMRHDNRSWDAIAAMFGLNRSVVRERGRAIGAARPPRPTIDLEALALANPGRDSLPAGHPRAWTVLTENTLLAAAPYPYPPFRAIDPVRERRRRRA